MAALSKIRVAAVAEMRASGMTLHQVGDELGITRQAVSNILQKQRRPASEDE